MTATTAPARGNLSPASNTDESKDLPGNWQDPDSLGSWEEGIRFLKEEHKSGAPVPEYFRSTREGK